MLSYITYDIRPLHGLCLLFMAKAIMVNKIEGEKLFVRDAGTDADPIDIIGLARCWFGIIKDSETEGYDPVGFLEQVFCP